MPRVCDIHPGLDCRVADVRRGLAPGTRAGLAPMEGFEMPQKAWTDKRERQYEHIKESYEERGVSTDEAEERAARTVNKERSEAGETKAQRKGGCAMTAIGYALSSEEHGPRDLVANARAAEEAGFSFALISDHFHPWIERHPHSPFVWGVLGAIAEATERSWSGPASPARRSAPIRRSSPTPRPPPPPDAGGSSSASGPARTSTSTSSASAGRSGRSGPRCSRRPSRSSVSCGAAR